LRELLHLRERFGDLVYSLRLFLAAHVYLADQNAHRFGTLRNLADRLRYLFQLGRTISGPLNGVLNQRGSVLRRLSAALRQISHLIRHHGKAHAGFPRPRCFHGRVQRQNIALEGDLIDDFGNRSK
jgi:hypothetical protein